MGKKTLREAYNRQAVARGLPTQSDTTMALAVHRWRAGILDGQRTWHGVPKAHCWLGIGLRETSHMGNGAGAREPGEEEDTP